MNRAIEWLLHATGFSAVIFLSAEAPDSFMRHLCRGSFT